MLSVKEWAEFTFSRCNLGDKRRTNRLIKILGSITGRINQSIVKSCSTEAEIEGTYRLIRNDYIAPEAIAEGGFEATAELAGNSETLLAIEDSTTLGFQHSVREELGSIASHPDAKTQGFIVHSVMLYDPQKQQTLGLIEQKRWIRDNNEFGKKVNRKKIPYEQKESYKWVEASQAVAKRLKDQHQHCISVCDREADVIEYLNYKHQHQQRFLVRAKSNRCLETGELLFDYIGALKEAGKYTIHVPQRGGRPARKAHLSLRFAPVQILPPVPKRKEIAPFQLTAILCEENSTDDSALKWILLTSEPVKTSEEARQIVSYYEARWKIEDFHKVWKTGGTNVEGLRLQTADNIERMAVILAFAAMRVFQLKEHGDSETLSQEPCSVCMPELYWKILFKKTAPKKRLPKSPPNMKWAYHAIGKLGGWRDSKRTGRVGHQALFEGWQHLEMLVDGYGLSLEM